MVELRQIRLIAAKHVLHYLKGTIHFSLRYVGGGELMLQGFIDSNWERDTSEMEVPQFIASVWV